MKLSLAGIKKYILFIPLAMFFMLFGLSFSLSLAQSENNPNSELLAGEYPTATSATTAVAATATSSTGADFIQSSDTVISMDFQNAALEDVLKIFSQQAGLNFVSQGPRVRGQQVTLYLDRVPVKDALDTLMRANNLTYEQKGNIFIVKVLDRPEIETITKIYPLQYARVKGYELSSSQKSDKTTSGIKDIITGLLSKDGQGKLIGAVIEDARTNSLIVSDVPSQFAQIEKAIKELDVKLPQVMIEVEIIETTTNTIDKLGIEWGTAAEGDLAEAWGSVRSSTYPFTKPNEHPSLERVGKVGYDGVPVTVSLGYISAANLGGILAMLKQDTDTKILAQPKVLALNNETAEIKIVSDEVLGVRVEVDADGNRTTEAERASDVSLVSEGVGVFLQVTPQINPRTEEITMLINPKVSRAFLSPLFPTVGADAEVKSTQSIVRVRDGETVIVGGLISSEGTKSMRKVPWVGDIPLLGNLFRKKDDEVTDREVVIFITPRMVREDMPGLALNMGDPWGYEDFELKEEAMDRILDQFEE
ncbi:MAG: hypothetical protein JW869_01260 [Candidatus Omnitrophica bacterium]|nr:hypothetical protein [Candidatus Omnitrophota bacterium]